MTTPTVYCVQEPLKRDGRGNVITRFDTAKLEPYGRVTHLLSWGELRDGFDSGRVLQKLRDRLQDFSDADFIVPVGNPALIGMAVAVAADINEGRVRILDWMRNDNCYREITLDMEWLPLEHVMPLARHKTSCALRMNPTLDRCTCGLDREVARNLSMRRPA